VSHVKSSLPITLKEDAEVTTVNYVKNMKKGEHLHKIRGEEQTKEQEQVQYQHLHQKRFHHRAFNFKDHLNNKFTIVN
jgi:hypothetical protein